MHRNGSRDLKRLGHLKHVAQVESRFVGQDVRDYFDGGMIGLALFVQEVASGVFDLLPRQLDSPVGKRRKAKHTVVV